MSFESPPEPSRNDTTSSPKGLLHGLEDLPPADREHYERQLHFRRPPTEQTNRYVRVPASDYLGRGFRESVAREIEMNPDHAEMLQRVERNADRYAHSFQTSDRLAY